MKRTSGDCGSSQKDRSLPEVKVIAERMGKNKAKEVNSVKRPAGNPGMSAAHQLMIKQREMMTHELDEYYNSKGLSVDIELGGPDKTFISLFSPLFCRDSVNRIVENTNFFLYLKKAGFRKATIGDNGRKVWVYDLKAL